MDAHIGAPSSWLSALVAPVAVDEFLSNYWLKQPLASHGPATRFSGLLSWPVLNDILERHWREPLRFRLVREGRDLDPASYVDRGGSTPRIRARDVTAHVRRGATLSFTAIDELHAPLRQLAESFEVFFNSDTKINVYAGWRALHGLDVHRDDQDVFILQVHGPKRWLLYGFSLDATARRHLPGKGAAPAGATFDQILEPGDLLYIPRGCYHVAVPMNQPALHLTVAVRNVRGADILRWIVERLRASAIGDRDVSLHAGSAERLQYSAALRAALLDALEPDLIEQYFREAGSNVGRRAAFSLPWSATPELLPAGQDFFVRLRLPSSLVVDSDSDSRSIEVQCGGRRYRFPRSLLWVLDQLNDGAQLRASLLIDRVAGHLDEEAVRLLLAMLVQHELVVITA